MTVSSVRVGEYFFVCVCFLNEYVTLVQAGARTCLHIKDVYFFSVTW